MAANAGALQRQLDGYVGGVVRDWERHWKGTDSRYGRDFHAFLGERVLTDFNLPHHDRSGLVVREPHAA